MNKVLSKILLCAATGSMLAGCFSGNDAPEITPGTALFDNFSYEGKDRFYEQNPLPDEQSFYTPILPGWYSYPSICTNGKGDYFLVTSTFTYFPGVPIFHSRDLVNWKQKFNCRVIYIISKLVAIFLTVTIKNNNVELIFFCVKLFKSSPSHST